MSQTNISIRIDEDIKKEAEDLFTRLGLNLSSAVNVFFRQAIREQAIPFQIKENDNYFNQNNMRHLMESIEQTKQGKTVTFTMEQLEEMANE